MLPVTMPGGKPVMDVPGATPISPATKENPVLVTVEAPRAPNVAAIPRLLACALVSRGRARQQAAAYMRTSII